MTEYSRKDERGAFDAPPCDRKTQSFIANDLLEGSAHDPFWRFGAIFEAERKARVLRMENARRHRVALNRCSNPASTAAAYVGPAEPYRRPWVPVFNDSYAANHLKAWEQYASQCK